MMILSTLRISPWYVLISLWILLFSSSCSPAPKIMPPQIYSQEPSEIVPTGPPKDKSQISELVSTAEIQPEVSLGFTYQQANGNRTIPGKGFLPSGTAMEVNLPGKPSWIVGAVHQNKPLWSVVLEDGSVLFYLITEKGVIEKQVPEMQLPAGMPPMLSSFPDQYQLVTVEDREKSVLTHPVYLLRTDQIAYITQSGRLKIVKRDGQLTASLDINALPDARIIVDEYDRLLVLSDPTTAYNHGVLGDNLEATSMTLIETILGPRVVTQIKMPPHEVIEGISPIWEDLDGDGQREIIATISTIDLGAGIVIFDESGERLAEGDKIGRTFRWRHQIGLIPSGPGENSELIVVRTPHIGGVVEYYQYSEGNLQISADFPGITSHVLGSRNLDLAVLGDFDGDNAIELLTPSPDLTELIAVRRNDSGAEEAWRLSFSGKLSTNLSGVTLPNGKISLAAGREDGFLMVWLP